MDIVLWTIAAFFLGSIPFSVLLGKLVKKDIRQVGDGNPGGANAIKAGGLKIGIPAIILDIAKGFVPVFLARRYGLAAWELVPVSLAPILGHAFSPFLKFHGGKALGATAGVSFALSGILAIIIFALMAIPFTLVQTDHGWSACAGMLAVLVCTLLFAEKWLAVFAALNTALIIWTHRRSLAHPPCPRPWVTNLLSRRGA